jgi:pimeloyl-ACP methyl ester carboxylesterase
MRRLLAVAGLCAALLGATSADAAGTIGLVLMHGKTGMPSQLAKLGAALTASGYLVDAPEMCWSKNRIFDKPLDECMAEIDKAAADLKSRGAGRIVVLGMSQGGAVALAYGARHPELAGIIALAPAADPTGLSNYADLQRSIKSAQAMMEAGQAETATDFNDIVNGKTIPVHATPQNFLSFHGPDSPIVTIKAMMTTVLPKLAEPLLWVSGDRDASQGIAGKAFATVPHKPLDRHVAVEADHVGTPDAAIPAVQDWLKLLK